MNTDLHKLTPGELGRLFPIILSAPRPDWPDYFIQEAHQIQKLLGNKIAKRIEHIGSTSVPDLPAKPTIDILVEICQGPKIKTRVIEIMTTNGYQYMHRQKKHIMVVKGYTPQGMMTPSYHIHLGHPGLPDLEDMLRFRDLLRSDPAVAREYQTLKEGLARRFKYDREAYTEAKTEFITQTCHR